MEVLQRIKFLMEYDVMKTSSENILVEQPRIRGASTSTVSDYLTPLPSWYFKPDDQLTDKEKWDKATYLSFYRKSDPSKTGTVRRGAQSGYDYLQRGRDRQRKMDAHDWFTYFQVLAVVGGIFSGGLTSAIFFISAAVLDLSEAYYFWKVDKDPYMAVIMAIFAVVHDMGLMEIPGLSRIIQERGKEGIKKLIKKNKDGYH
jgi:hypothetical protein